MMKIRTDYVTNSSSASSAQISVENPILLEILQRYKDMGVFGDTEMQFEIGVTFNASGSSDGHTGFCRHVSSLQEVLTEIISIMDDSDFVDDPSGYDQDLFKEMVSELMQRKAEIDNAYLSVKWQANDWSWGQDIYPGDENSWEYHYDPVNGESYTVETFEEDE